MSEGWAVAAAVLLFAAFALAVGALIVLADQGVEGAGGRRVALTFAAAVALGLLGAVCAGIAS